MKQKPAFKATKLTKKQLLFIQEYQRDFCGAKAAVRAGYSLKRAAEMAYQLLQIPTVRKALDRAVEERLRKIGVHAEKVLTRMAQLAFADIRKIFGPNGTLLSPEEWPDDITSAVAGVEVFEEFQGKGESRTLIGHTKKVRLWDPNPSLTNMAKHLGIIGNGKHHDEEGEDGDSRGGQQWTTLELSAKIVYLVKLAVRRKEEAEQAQLERKGCNPQL